MDPEDTSKLTLEVVEILELAVAEGHVPKRLEGMPSGPPEFTSETLSKKHKRSNKQKLNLKDITHLPMDKDEEALVQDLIKKGNVKNLLCKHALQASNDLFEYAKGVIPSLIVLSATSTIALSPTVIAGLLIIVARIGLTRYCEGCNEK